jgi:hypothetical protein
MSSSIRLKSHRIHLSVQQWSSTMTTSLLPQANKMEERAHLSTIEAKENRVFYSPPCLPTRES